LPIDSEIFRKGNCNVSTAVPIIEKVITQMESEDGWVPLGEVGRQLANLASDFDPRTFGFRKLSDLARRTNSFEIEHPKGGSMRIRLKASPAGSSPAAVGLCPFAKRIDHSQTGLSKQSGALIVFRRG
jgi:hypothetical protein